MDFASRGHWKRQMRNYPWWRRRVLRLASIATHAHSNLYPLQKLFLLVSRLLYQWSLFEQQLYGSVDRSGKSQTVYLSLVLLLRLCLSEKLVVIEQ